MSTDPALSPDLRRILDEIDNTRSVTELRTLMQPLWTDNGMPNDQLVRIWDERREKEAREEQEQA